MTASTTRRSVLAAAGAAGAAVSLAACGSGDSGGGGGDAAGEAADDGGSKEEGGAEAGGAAGSLGKATDIPEGGGKIFKEQKVVVTRPSAAEYKAFSATCTHKGCMVSEVANGTINCACHNSKFDIADGTVTSGPAQRGLPAAKVSVKGGKIQLAD